MRLGVIVAVFAEMARQHGRAPVQVCIFCFDIRRSCQLTIFRLHATESTVSRA